MPCKSKTLSLIILLSPLSIPMNAQSEQPWEQYFSQLYGIDEVENERMEEDYERLCELHENKIDLNHATKDDLESLPFLSDTQIEEIAEYVHRYGPVRSIGELAMVESLDAPRRTLLQHFVFIGDEGAREQFPKFSDILKYGKNDLTATARVPLYNREGDRNGYLGYKYKHWFRYTFKLGQFVNAGIVGSQDSGEPFLAGKNKWGYDYYSFYLLLRKMGRIKTLAVGRYKLRFGMGLALNNNFAFGKIAALSAPTTGNAIRAHSSRTESNYLQGVAATVGIIKNLDATAFLSYRKLDATLSSDGKTITTLLTTGYHRTESELSRKHNASQSLLGGNLNYRCGGLHMGATAFHTSFDKPLLPNKSQAFRQHYPTGKSFWNASLDYGYLHHRFSFDGETATGNGGGVATLNRLTFMASSTLSLTAIQRYYASRYNSLFSESFSEGGRAQNESGLYIGATWIPSPSLTLTAYSDYAYFAWPRYGVSQASHASDNFVSMAVKRGDFSCLVRYRLRLRQQDNTDKSALIDKTEHRARTAFGYEHERLKTTLQADIAYCSASDDSFGWMLSPTVSYAWPKVSLNAWVAYFDTDDYQSRLYTYERGMLYSFAFPMFYGHGMRFGLHAKTDLLKNLTLTGKVATTKYFDRKHISSSLQQINSSSMTDIDLQLRWKF